MKKNKESIKAVGIWSLRKFQNQEAFQNNMPYFSEIIGKNILLNGGINELWTILCSAGGTKYDNDNAWLFVGTDATPAEATQDELLGSPVGKAVDDGFPTFGTDEKATWQSTFNGAEANQDWNEFALTNGETGIYFNRLVSDQGTKISGQIWQLQLEITLS